ncbi:hypothetical protein BDK51DRAFT_37675 [Blyttiomyces helicus]|uniref:Uncharacterized protein n=1 Tax=Blyttiomyces helicus TaxID=388810 RepID=A0A4P9W3A2_9FUNG|nr:hypothetical protein BDK51DRAFT_37675 [Blyttiomyces helicus]|eukprot:RKO85120.1 hypothetical protein BDK51DRAFT_37675 [Blyttiomyces helicus]
MPASSESAGTNPASASSAGKPDAVSEKEASDPFAPTTANSPGPVFISQPEAKSVKDQTGPACCRIHRVVALPATRLNSERQDPHHHSSETHPCYTPHLATHETKIRDAVRRDEPDRAWLHLNDMRAHALALIPTLLTDVIVGLVRANRLADAEIALDELGDVPTEARTLAVVMNALAREADAAEAALIDYLKQFVHAARIDGFEFTLASLKALTHTNLDLPTPRLELLDRVIAAIIDRGDGDSPDPGGAAREEAAQKLLEDMLELGVQPMTESFNAFIVRQIADGKAA